jgi:alpha-L-rhamnosidase
VNGVSNPLAVDRDAVRFTWRQADAGRGAVQTAYQILVATSRKHLAAGKGDLWDSDKVESDRSAAVAYSGAALPAATRLWWKVREWNKAGKPGPFSAPAWFDSGLEQSEWRAKYIWDGTSNENNFAYFRKVFRVEQTPHLAKVYVTAHNDYLLYLNGELLGRGPAPGLRIPRTSSSNTSAAFSRRAADLPPSTSGRRWAASRLRKARYPQ